MRETWQIPLQVAMLLADSSFCALKLAFDHDPKETLSAWSRRVLARLKVEVIVEGECPLGCLWVANHLSWIDPLALLAQRSSGVLAKEEVAHYPVLGWGARKAGLHFVRREDPASRAAACISLAQELAAGREFLLFPEGTTTRGGGLAPLYEGGIRLAYRMGVPVLPISLHTAERHYPWTDDEELVTHAATLIRQGGARLVLHPGVLLNPAQFAHEAEWVLAIREAIDPRNQERTRCA